MDFSCAHSLLWRKEIFLKIHSFPKNECFACIYVCLEARGQQTLDPVGLG